MTKIEEVFSESDEYDPSVIALLTSRMEPGEFLMFCKDCGFPYISHHTYRNERCMKHSGIGRAYGGTGFYNLEGKRKKMGEP